MTHPVYSNALHQVFAQHRMGFYLVAPPQIPGDQHDTPFWVGDSEANDVLLADSSIVALHSVQSDPKCASVTAATALGKPRLQAHYNFLYHLVQKAAQAAPTREKQKTTDVRHGWLSRSQQE